VRGGNGVSPQPAASDMGNLLKQVRCDFVIIDLVGNAVDEEAIGYTICEPIVLAVR